MQEDVLLLLFVDDRDNIVVQEWAIGSSYNADDDHQELGEEKDVGDFPFAIKGILLLINLYPSNYHPSSQVNIHWKHTA